VRTTAPVLLIAVLLAGCTRGGAADETAPRPAASTAAVQVASRPVDGTCTLTLPNGQTPANSNRAGMNHGNGRMWTVLWPHNVVIADPA
jgi:hypothetical protein